MKIALRAKVNHESNFSDGFYTGKSYIYQGSRYAVVERDSSQAKIYQSLKRAEKACEVSFVNYQFKVEIIEE